MLDRFDSVAAAIQPYADERAFAPKTATLAKIEYAPRTNTFDVIDRIKRKKRGLGIVLCMYPRVLWMSERTKNGCSSL